MVCHPNPTHVLILLQILTSLNVIYLASCQTSDRNETVDVDQNIGEMGEPEPWTSRKYWTSEEEKRNILLLMQNMDRNTEKRILQEFGTELLVASSENTENSTQPELKRILPFGIEDYMFSEKDFMDSANSTNEMKSNADNVRFFLYTKKSYLNPDELFINDRDTVKNSNFIPNALVKVIALGFDTNTIKSLSFLNLNDSYLDPQTKDLNVILIDWYNLGIGPNLLAGLHNLQIAAEQIAKFVKFLVEQRITTLDGVHLIGHSLGCHLVGDTGFYINQLMGQKVSRVTGLDPVLPLFALADERGRIDPSDGSFVDVIHTSGLETGILRSLGHADFYVNGGLFQPGCSDLDTQVACSHKLALRYFSESILYPMAFKACKCMENILSGFSSCPCNGTDSTDYMGMHLTTSARGIYYLETNDKPLYGKG